MGGDDAEPPKLTETPANGPAEGPAGGLVELGSPGTELFQLASDLFPVCRSITGDGVRQTLDLLQAHAGAHARFEVHEVPSGTAAFDWTVPQEWNVREAFIANSRGERVVDLARSTLQLVSYSVPVRAKLSLAELDKHLHSLPAQPDLIPYRTAYYEPDWGFCLTHRQRQALPEDTYDVVVDTEFSNGALTYGEFLKPGDTADEILLSAHVCHPSLANDNCSGLALLAHLARHLAARRTRYSYRLLFAPGTIGAITWLARNRDTATRIKHGLVVSNAGDGGGPTYKRSRRGNAEIDRAAALVLAHSGLAAPRVLDFSPYGYDERQYCSPGFDLAVGSLQRSCWGTFPEYHTSADNLDFIRPEHLASSFRLVTDILDVLEGNRRFRNLSPHCEPQLGKRGLYSSTGGAMLSHSTRMGLLWVLNLSDGRHSLLDIAERSGLAFAAVQEASQRLLAAGLLAVEPDSNP